MIWRHACLSSSTYWRTWDVSCKLKSTQQMSFRPHHFASFFNRWMGVDLGIALFICLVSISIYFYVFLVFLNQLLPGQTELTSEMRELRDRCHEQVELLIAKWDRVAACCSYPVHKTTTSLFSWFCQSWHEKCTHPWQTNSTNTLDKRFAPLHKRSKRTRRQKGTWLPQTFNCDAHEDLWKPVAPENQMSRPQPITNKRASKAHGLTAKKQSQEPAVLAKSREGQKSCERIWRWKPCIFKGFFARGCVFCCVCCAMLCSSCSPSLQGQTVGLLTQRLADARSAIAAELQDAATERAPSKVRRISKNHKTS